MKRHTSEGRSNAQLLKYALGALCTLALLPCARAVNSADNQVFFDFENQSSPPTVFDMTTSADNGAFTSTRGNDPTFTTAEHFRGLGAADFTHTNAVDGAYYGQRIEIANSIAFSGDYTISMFLKPAGFPTGGKVSPLFSKGLHGQLPGNFQFYLIGNQLGYDNYNGGAHFTAPVPLLPGVWNHVALVRSNNTVQLYVNDTVDGSAVADSATSPLSAPSYIGILGFSPASEYGIYGYLDNVLITDRAFSAQEIFALPEPSTVVLMGLAGLGLLGRLRKS